MKPATDYKLRTAQSWRGMRTKHERRKALIQSVKSAAFVIAGLLGLLSVHGWMVERDLAETERKAAKDAKHGQAQAYALVANLMNGRTVLDRETGDVFFFQVSTQRGL